MLSQIGGGDGLLNIVYFIMFMALIFLYPRLMTTQTIWKLEKDVAELEGMAEKSRSIALHAISRKPTREQREAVRGFMEFFAVSPVDMDPYGIVKKVDMVIKQMDFRFTYFVNQIAPNASAVQKANIKDALLGAMQSHQIAKIVRHFLETIKKYKIFQLAMILQMQIPLIVRVAKAAVRATKAFADGMPVGDGIGPLVTARLMKRVKRFSEEEFVLGSANIAGRSVLVAKALGPGASTGYPGKFLLKLLKKQRIDRIITVDAALKMEGEKTGSLAEGVGVAMGGSGVDRYEIEEVAVAKKIPLDAVAIKVSDEDALSVMRRELVEAAPQALKMVEAAVRRAGTKEKILIIGVGNTCGVGNDSASAELSVNKLASHWKTEKPEGEKKSGWF